MHTSNLTWLSCVSIRCGGIGENVLQFFLFPNLFFFSDNEDPMVRGLALRSLCNLRLESILEYVAQPLQKSLNDLSPYVRKTGVMGILKVKSTFDPNMFKYHLD